MMNRMAYTEIWFINNFMLSPARDGSVTVFAVLAHNLGVFAHNMIDIHQKKYGFYAKNGENSLPVRKIAVPLHRQKETSRHLQ